MADATFSADFNHPYIRREWRWRKAGTSGWYPVDEIFAGRVTDQGGNTIKITDVTQADFGDIKCTAITVGQVEVDSDIATLGAPAMSVTVEPLNMVIGVPPATNEYIYDFTSGAFDTQVWTHIRTSGATVTQLDGTVDVLPADPDGTARGEGMIAGKGLQIEDASTNSINNSEGMADWVADPDASIVPGIDDPAGGTNAARITVDNTTDGDITLAGVPFGSGTTCAPLIYVRRHDISSTGAVQFQNAANWTLGQWQFDLSDLTVGRWYRLDQLETDIVTVLHPFSRSEGGSVPLLVHGVNAGSRVFDWYAIQLESFDSSLPTTSYIPTPYVATGSRSPVYVTGEIAAMNLENPVQNAFSFQQLGELVVESGTVNVLFALTASDDGSTVEPIILIFKDVDDVLKVGYYDGTNDWPTDDGPLITNFGVGEVNLRGKFEVIGNDIVMTVWFNNVKHIYTLPNRSVPAPFTHVALMHRNQQFVTNGVCRKMRLLDYAADDQTIFDWDYPPDTAIQWSAVDTALDGQASTVTSYEVEYGDVATGTLQTTTVTDLYFDTYGIQADGTVYRYRVRSIDDQGRKSQPSGWIYNDLL